jgi:hypothetical protein
MSISGRPTLFTPPGPKIPSDSVNSKSKVNDLSYPYSKLALSSYSTAASSLLVQIPDAPAGMLVFNSDTGKLNFFDGTAWQVVTSV